MSLGLIFTEVLSTTQTEAIEAAFCDYGERRSKTQLTCTLTLESAGASSGRRLLAQAYTLLVEGSINTTAWSAAERGGDERLNAVLAATGSESVALVPAVYPPIVLAFLRPFVSDEFTNDVQTFYKQGALVELGRIQYKCGSGVWMSQCEEPDTAPSFRIEIATSPALSTGLLEVQLFSALGSAVSVPEHRFALHGLRRRSDNVTRVEFNIVLGDPTADVIYSAIADQLEDPESAFSTNVIGGNVLALRRACPNGEYEEICTLMVVPKGLGLRIALLVEYGPDTSSLLQTLLQELSEAAAIEANALHLVSARQVSNQTEVILVLVLPEAEAKAVYNVLRGQAKTELSRLKSGPTGALVGSIERQCSADETSYFAEFAEECPDGFLPPAVQGGAGLNIKSLPLEAIILLIVAVVLMAFCCVVVGLLACKTKKHRQIVREKRHAVGIDPGDEEEPKNAEAYDQASGMLDKRDFTGPRIHTERPRPPDIEMMTRAAERDHRNSQYGSPSKSRKDGRPRGATRQEGTVPFTHGPIKRGLQAWTHLSDEESEDPVDTSPEHSVYQRGSTSRPWKSPGSQKTVNSRRRAEGLRAPVDEYETEVSISSVGSYYKAGDRFVFADHDSD